MKRTQLAILITALVSQSALAEQQEPSLEVGETMTVVAQQGIANSTTTGSKMDVPIKELPFSVAVVDQQFIQDTGVKNIQDALLYTSGVYAGTFGLDSRGDWTKIRGVAPTQYLDGMKTNFGNYNNTRPDPFSLERIEILKGPSSVLYGQGSTGGTINLVSKLPQQQAAHQLWLQGGSHQRKQVAIDSTGPIANSKLLYRIVGLARKADTQVEHTEDNRYLINPSLTWMISPETNLTLLANFQKDETGTVLQFVPAEGSLYAGPNGQYIARSTFLSEPGWDGYDTEQTSFSALFDHRFNAIWSLAANARYTDSESDYRSMWSLPTGATNPDGTPIYYLPDGSINRAAYHKQGQSKVFNADVRATANFLTGNVEHALLMGIDAQQAKTRDDVWYGSGGTINPYAPVYGNVPSGYTISPGAENTNSQLGLYVSDQITLQRASINAGLRYDSTKTETDGSSISPSDQAFSGRLGAMYHFDSGVSPYLSYSQSFEPQGTVNDANSGQTLYLDPLRGEQYELGLKYQPEGQDLLATLAVYDIAQSNRAQADPNGGIRSLAEVSIRGAEFEVNKQWQQFELLASYTYQQTEDKQNGHRLAYIPDQLASAWASYRFSDRLEGLRIGLGSRYVGDTTDGSDLYSVPAYTVFDAMVAYQTGQWELSADAKNLFDKNYVAYCSSSGTCGYGEGLYVTANARYNF
ncbi:TonB-dependent siderophore receptor [Agarivorans gilvus]|uniref:Ferrisiderophore receptor n=1 Tax=Agarivorans gilvus TaxID=680279 RepID=A0ABQ1I5X0_9ALTE|nr:TonB-dependent siderophore receptor [Agarivorans gilvus]GGB19970.1 ferrisiderophore receptor [Agarivorans gilvus]